MVAKASRRTKSAREAMFDPIDATETPANSDLSSAMARIDALQAQLDRVSAENLALLSKPVTIMDPTPAPKPVVDLTNLPDPLHEGEKYAATLQSRIQAGLDATVATTTARLQSNETLNKQVEQLWEDFGKKYPQFADRSDLAEFAAQKVIVRAQEQGIDTNAYMFRTRDRFLDDVAGYLKDLVPAPSDSAQSDNNSAQSDADTSDVETASVFDGTSAFAPGSGKSSGEGVEKLGSLRSDLTNMQRRMGYY